MTKKDVKDSLGARGMSAKLFEVLKEPQITQTSPPGQREKDNVCWQGVLQIVDFY